MGRLASEPASAADLVPLFTPRCGAMRALRTRMLSLLTEDVFAHRYGESLSSERARCWARIMRLARAGVFTNTLTASGDARAAAAARYDTVLQAVALLDHSLEVKLGVSLGLFGTTVRKLGSAAQGAAWLGRIERFEEFGCFALTELGHGSNVRGIETTATYDPARRGFVLRTPTETAQKYWIGGAAASSTVAAVFAQLHVGGENRGIHAFVVRLRERPDAPTLPGIHVEDCGVKAGLNGVDNGRIWFDSLLVPREDMLSGTAQVAEDGTYTSQYDSPDARFGAALAALTGGRVSIAMNAVNAAKVGLTIAVRYALSRRAFAPQRGAQETALLSYTSHQRRLMLPLAAAYVYSMCADDLRDMWTQCVLSDAVTKEVHVLSAGFKAQFTWFMSDALQHARECCGGQGYKADNRICVLRADRDVMLTFEGANDVMMQQVGKALLAEYASSRTLLNDDPKAAAAAAAVDKAFPAPQGVPSAAAIRRILHACEQKLVRALALKVSTLAKGKKGSASYGDAWNACLNPASAAATAHLNRLIWDMHMGHVSATRKRDSEAAAAVVRLCGQAWALHVMDSDTAFLRLGCLSVRQASDVHAAIEGVCARMAAQADTLVDAFDLPPHMLAPIAFDYVAHNSRSRM